MKRAISFLLFVLFINNSIVAQIFNQYDFKITGNFNLKEISTTYDGNNKAISFDNTVYLNDYDICAYRVIIINFKEKITDLDTYFETLVKENRNLGGTVKQVYFKGNRAVKVVNRVLVEGTYFNQIQLYMFHNNKSYILAILTSSYKHESLFSDYIKHFYFLSDNTKSNSLYYSQKYNYSINIPKNFNKGEKSSPNNDFMYYDINGTNITITVTRRDYSFSSPHSLSKELMYNIFKNLDPNVYIYGVEKIYINGLKVFKHIQEIKFPENNYKLTQLIYTIYKGKYQFLITMTCSPGNFNHYKSVFEQTAKSFQFKY